MQIEKTMKNFLAVMLILGSVAYGNDFVSMFNGKDLSGWSMMPDKAPTFSVVDGLLDTRYVRKGSDLFTQDHYANYIFRFEYMLSKDGNSGVLIRCDPKNPWGTGAEIQLLAPWTPYRDDLHCTGSIYGIVAVTNRPDETVDIWHTMEIRLDRNLIDILVDGKLTTHADLSKLKAFNDKWISGTIGLQSNHSKKGTTVRFRNLMIRNLDQEQDYVLKGLNHVDERFRVQAIGAAVKLGAVMVAPLARMMDGGDVMSSTTSKQALFDIVAAASAPQGDARKREAVVQALRQALEAKLSPVTNEYLKWLLGMLE